MELHTKREMVEALDSARADWAAVLDGLTPEQMEQHGALGDWPFRDVVSHLTGWRKRTVARFEAAQRGSELEPPPWPAEMDDDDGVDDVNAWIHESDSKRPLAEVLAESDSTFQRLDTALRAIPEEDLLAPGRFSSTGPYSLGYYLEGSLEHYDEHKQELRDWLATRQQQRD